MKSYRPDVRQVGNGLEQSFDANFVHVEDMGEGVWLIMFGELVPREGKPLWTGRKVHSFGVSLADDPAHDSVAFNGLHDQRRITTGVERIELSPTSFRVTFVSGRGPVAGRVLPAELEFLTDEDDVDERPSLTSVRVNFAPAPEKVAMLEKALRGCESTRGFLKVLSA